MGEHGRRGEGERWRREPCMPCSVVKSGVWSGRGTVGLCSVLRYAAAAVWGRCGWHAGGTRVARRWHAGGTRAPTDTDPSDRHRPTVHPPVERQSTWTPGPPGRLCRVVRVGPKNMASSSGWAMTRSTAAIRASGDRRHGCVDGRRAGRERERETHTERERDRESACARGRPQEAVSRSDCGRWVCGGAHVAINWSSSVLCSDEEVSGGGGRRQRPVN